MTPMIDRKPKTRVPRSGQAAAYGAKRDTADDKALRGYLARQPEWFVDEQDYSDLVNDLDGCF